MHRTRIANRARLGVAASLAALAALLIGALLGPQHQVVGDQVSGDPALAQRVHDAVDGVGGYRSLVVAEVTPDGYTWAGLGNSGSGRDGPAPDQESVYEPGSVTKTFTAALFADAVERGEVAPDDQLGEHLPELADTDAGRVTLASLAQHSSGLPGLGATASRRLMLNAYFNENLYATSSTEQLIADARSAPVDPDQPPTYSNLGWSLLGAALARAAGAGDYATLLAERVTEPLGMTSTGVAATDADYPAQTVPGFKVNGLPAPHWPGEGYLPSGTAAYTTIGDLASWAQAQLNGTAPGIAALEPTADYAPSARIGWAWLTSEDTTDDGSTQTMVWHNGMTAGFSAMVALDRDADRAVVVLGNTDMAVDPIAPALLYGTDVPELPAQLLFMSWLLLGLAVILSLLALWSAFRSKAVLPVINSMLFAAAVLVVLWAWGPWTAVGGWAFGLAMAPALAGVAVIAMRARRLPFRPPHAWATWLGIATALLLLAGATRLW